jgi:dipeptidyl aminopeptidase/acylaminoacyl peptidase
MSSSDTWRARFTQPRIVATTVATADRTAGLVTVADGHAYRLYAWDVPTGAIRLADLPPADPYYFATWLSHDGRHAYVVADEKGDELGHLTALDLRDGTAPVDLTPALDRYTVRGVGISHSGAGLALDAVDEAGYHVYYLASPSDANREPQLLASYPDEAWNCLLSADGALVTVDTTDRNPGRRQFAVQALRVTDGEPLGVFADGPGSSIEAHLFSPRPGDPTAAVVTDRSGSRRPVLWQIGDGSRRPLHLGDLPGDVVPLDWSDDGRYLLLCQLWRAAQRLLRYDLDTDQFEMLDLPAGSYHGELLRRAHFGPGSYFGPDGAVLAATESMAAPLTVYRHQPGGRTEAVLASEAAPPGRSARSIDLRSSDGTLVQGWLVTPDSTGPHPTVVYVHGGPHMAWWDFFYPAAQMWVDRGYAFFALNFRGSTSFGKQYKEAIWGDVGRWELEDLVAARQWLVEHRVAYPDRMLMAGGSYGGYLTLYALTVRPTLWAGGIAEVAIADWTMTYEDANPANRRAFATWLGGTPEQVPERYRERSPLTYIEDLAAPLLIRQARHDSRTPERQLRAFETEAQRLGKPVTVVWDERGHSPLADELAFRQRSLEFAAGCVASRR